MERSSVIVAQTCLTYSSGSWYYPGSVLQSFTIGKELNAEVLLTTVEIGAEKEDKSTRSAPGG